MFVHWPLKGSEFKLAYLVHKNISCKQKGYSIIIIIDILIKSILK
jgi:hypothetical protein